MDYSIQYQAIDRFLERAPVQDSVLTLGGAGPNGSSQVAPLVYLGAERIDQLSSINIMSASSYAYLIVYAFNKGLLNAQNYLVYDGLMRRLHNASFLRGLAYFALRRYRSKPIYNNSVIKSTAEILFSPDLVEMELNQLPLNIRFWCYCSRVGDNVELSAATFPEMRVWQAITACVGVDAFHGRFMYKGHRLSDANYSPKTGALRRTLFKDKKNHLYFNYKTTCDSGNVIYIQNQTTSFPNLRLGLDLAKLVLNIPNDRVSKTNKFALKQLNAINRFAPGSSPSI